MQIVLGIIMLITTTVSGSLGALLFKKAMNKMDKLSIKNLLTSGLVWSGVILYIVSALTNIQLLKYLDYTVVFPLTALTYIWTIIFSYFAFKEKITWKKILASVFVIAGMALVVL